MGEERWQGRSFFEMFICQSSKNTPRGNKTAIELVLGGFLHRGWETGVATDG
jgi:hypothetical protein